MAKIETIRGVENREVVSHKEWLVARKKLLVKEKRFSRLRDALNQQRRKLPWVKVEKEYVFDGPNGKETLADLFCGKSQLIVYHFMFGPGWKEGCPERPSWPTRHHVRRNFPGAVEGNRSVQKAHGLEVQVAFVVRVGFQF